MVHCWNLTARLLAGIPILFVAVAAPADPPKDRDVIALGAAVSLTGKYSLDGQNTKEGYDLAVQRINELGGVKVGSKSYKLQIVYYDDESTSARAAQLVERLVSQDGVQFLLGPYGSSITKAIAPITEKYRIPMIEANGADRSLFNNGYKYLFAVLNTSDHYLRSAIDVVEEQVRKAGKEATSLKVAIVIENDDFAEDVRSGIIEETTRYGMRVVIDEKLPPELNDMSSALTKVRALKPDVLVVSGHAKGAVLAIKQISEQRVNVGALALTQCDAAQIVEKFGKAAEYALCATQWDRTLAYKDRWFGSAEDYAQRFEQQYKHTVTYGSAESSAAVLTFVDALERAGSLDREKVRDAIAATDLVTFYGPVRFDATGKNVAKSMALYQVQGGQYRVVAPPKWANTAVVYPAPEWDARR
jgi:branched-chain amino acid transport system substrate-binding protein